MHLRHLPMAAVGLLLAGCAGSGSSEQGLVLNELEYFEEQGANVLVYSNDFNGGFNDEKNSGIEIIHHGVRTVQGGAVRLNKTPEQWDLVPKTTNRIVNTTDNSIEIDLRYEDYDFNSRIVVTGKGKAVEVAVYLDKPVPAALVGDAGFNMEFLPSQYWAKTYLMDGRLNRFPRITASETITRPNAEKAKQFKGFKTYDDRGTDQFVDPLPLEAGHTILMAPETGYNDALANRALTQSKRLLKEASDLLANDPKRHISGEHDSLALAGFGNMSANLQLYASTHEAQYRDEFLGMVWKALDKNVTYTIKNALDAIPYMDEAYREQLRPYVAKYNDYIKSLEKDNPYGVPITLGNWAGSPQVATFGTTICYASKYYPDLVDKNDAYKAAAWVFGRHPYHNYSLVAVVGATRPKAVFYGNNRADFSFIPGNMAPGLLFRKPDHFENYDDWPFLWGQNEGTIAGNTTYLIFGSAFKETMKAAQ